RTSRAGEGLQHQDGSSHLWAMTISNCRSYDPAFAGELAVIIAHGMQRMMVEQRDEFYYLTVMNENYVQAALPEGVEDDVIKGAYRFRHYPAQGLSGAERSEEHTSELQSRENLVCRHLLEKKRGQ